MSKPTVPCVVNLSPLDVRVGMVGYARTDGTLGFLIRVGERHEDGAGKYNHEFVVVGEGSTYDEIQVVQATLRGVKKTSLQDIIASAHIVDLFPPPADADVDRLVKFCLSQVGDDYSLLAILCIAVDIVTSESAPAFRRDYTWICSALTEFALLYAGSYHEWPDVYTPTPMQSYLARYGNATA